jgi:dihydroneopterin aldolase
MPQERLVGGDFVVDLRVGYPLESAMHSDEVADTLDYARLYTLVEHEMQQTSKLLEHVAGRIAEAIEKNFPMVTSIDLTVTKQNPPMGADCHGAAVEIHLINDKTA